jgi:1-acyl-sn-glycerol-3-phosphate acyltransferase
LSFVQVLSRLGRAARSLLFFAVYAVYLVAFFGLVQRVVVWPLVLIRPKRRYDIVGAWFRVLADSTLRLARVLADVRLDVRGGVPPGSAVVVMNHQSLLDVPIAYSIVSRPYPVIPTRRLYARGIPGVSPLLRLARAPFVSQTREGARADVKSITRATEEVAAGRLSMLIFPEGHRTYDGQLSPFMTGGLRVVLSRARRPVYLIVADGLWHARTAGDALFNFAGTRGRVRVIGPLPPPEPGDTETFIAGLEARMGAVLAEMRA